MKNENRMRYFVLTKETTVEELRKRYKKLGKMDHPDRGRDNAAQAQINAVYSQVLK